MFLAETDYFKTGGSVLNHLHFIRSTTGGRKYAEFQLALFFCYVHFRFRQNQFNPDAWRMLQKKKGMIHQGGQSQVFIEIIFGFTVSPAGTVMFLLDGPTYLSILVGKPFHGMMIMVQGF